MITRNELDAAYETCQTTTRMLGDDDIASGLQTWIAAQDFDLDDLRLFLQQLSNGWLMTAIAADKDAQNTIGSAIMIGLQMGWILCLQHAPLDLDFKDVPRDDPPHDQNG